MQDDNQAQFEKTTRFKIDMQEAKTLSREFVKLMLLPLILLVCPYVFRLMCDESYAITVLVGLGLYLAYHRKKFRVITVPPCGEEISSIRPTENQSSEVDQSKQPQSEETHARLPRSESSSLHGQPERVISLSPEIERMNGRTSKPVRPTVEDSLLFLKGTVEGIGWREHNALITEVEKFRRLSGSSLKVTSMVVEKNRAIVRYVKNTSMSNKCNEESAAPTENKNSTAVESKGAASKVFERSKFYERKTSPRKIVQKGNQWVLNDTYEEESIEVMESRLKNEYAIQRMNKTWYADDNVSRELTLLENGLRKIVPGAEVVLTELQQEPRFVATCGSNSVLGRIDKKRGLLHEVGRPTAILSGCSRGGDFILTAGHNTNVGDTIGIVRDDQTVEEIGKVKKKIVDNVEIPVEHHDGQLGDAMVHVLKLIEGDNGRFVDAALIELHEGKLESIKNEVIINSIPHKISPTLELPEVNRVVLRAKDNDNVKGVVTNTILDIFETEDGPMYGCTAIKYLNEDYSLRGAIHTEGDSGLLCTHEPEPTNEANGIVKPVLMLIGLYDEFDNKGRYDSSISVGIELGRVINSLECCAKFGEKFAILCNSRN